MSCRPAPACAAGLAQATALWPNRNRASDGTCASQGHSQQNPTSDHEPNARGLATAFDLTHDPANGCDCNVLSEQVKDDPRVKYVIWNRRIYNPAISRTWRGYTGSNPHHHHMHVSVTDAAENDTRPWYTEEDDVELSELRAELVNADKRAKAREDALLDELKEQAKRHATAARDRDVKLLAVLDRIEAKLG